MAAIMYGTSVLLDLFDSNSNMSQLQFEGEAAALRSGPNDSPIKTVGDVVDGPTGPRLRPYWMQPPKPGGADVIPLRPALPAPVIQPRLDPVPLFVPNINLFRNYLDYIRGLNVPGA